MPEAVQPYIAPVTETLGSISIDIFVIAGIILGLFLFGLWFGKTHLASLIFAFPLAAFAYSIFGHPQLFSTLGESTKQLAVARLVFFGIASAVFSLLIDRMAYAYSALSVTARWFDLGLLAVAATASLLALYHGPLNLTPIYQFGPSIAALFAPSYTFWWMVASLIALFIAIRR